MRGHIPPPVEAGWCSQVVGASDFRFEVASLASSLLCCFLGQETLLHIVTRRPGPSCSKLA